MWQLLDPHKVVDIKIQKVRKSLGQRVSPNPFLSKLPLLLTCKLLLITGQRVRTPEPESRILHLCTVCVCLLTGGSDSGSTEEWHSVERSCPWPWEPLTAGLSGCSSTGLCIPFKILHNEKQLNKWQKNLRKEKRINKSPSLLEFQVQCLVMSEADVCQSSRKCSKHAQAVILILKGYIFIQVQVLKLCSIMPNCPGSERIQAVYVCGSWLVFVFLRINLIIPSLGRGCCPFKHAVDVFFLQTSLRCSHLHILR